MLDSGQSWVGEWTGLLKLSTGQISELSVGVGNFVQECLKWVGVGEVSQRFCRYNYHWPRVWQDCVSVWSGWDWSDIVREQ